MTAKKIIVLDANILVRLILGKRVREIILDNLNNAVFVTPEICYVEARKHLPKVLEKRGLPAQAAIDLLNGFTAYIQPIAEEGYRDYQEKALSRIGSRDADDWPIVACALALDCPIWTEDNDFFGVGIPTWTTDRIAFFF